MMISLASSLIISLVFFSINLFVHSHNNIVSNN